MLRKGATEGPENVYMGRSFWGLGVSYSRILPSNIMNVAQRKRDMMRDGKCVIAAEPLLISQE